MSRKQMIYCEIFEKIMPFMRNIQTHSAWQRFKYGSFYPEMELVHNLHRLLLLSEFTEYDVHWLNAQAKIFVDGGNNPGHGLYDSITALISELFTLVPDQLKHRLRWGGPGNQAPVGG